MLFLRRHSSLVKSVLLIIIILITIFLVLHNTLLPLFFSLAEAETVKIANKAINIAVESESKSVKYEDLIDYKLDKNGNIILMRPNVEQVNQFSSQVALNIQRRLGKVNGIMVGIPVFKVLGLDILAGFGPDIKARVVPVGFLHPPSIADSFTSAGINQTRHKIYINVDVKLKLIVPFSQKTFQVKAEVPVTEVTILGKVPDVYVGLNQEQIPGIMNKTNN